MGTVYNIMYIEIREEWVNGDPKTYLLVDVCDDIFAYDLASMCWPIRGWRDTYSRQKNR